MGIKLTTAYIIYHNWRITYRATRMLSEELLVPCSEAPCDWLVKLVVAKAKPCVSRTTCLQPSSSFITGRSHLRIYLCLPLVSTEVAEILSIGEPNPGKLLFFLVSVTSFSRDTSSSSRNSLAARLEAAFSSLAVGCASMPRAAEGSKGCKRKQGWLFTAEGPENFFQSISKQKPYKYTFTRMLILGFFVLKQSCFFLWNLVIGQQQEFDIKGFLVELNSSLLLKESSKS